MSVMDVRGRHGFRIGLLLLCLIIMAYTLGNLYYSDVHLKGHSFELPGRLKFGSWLSPSQNSTDLSLLSNGSHPFPLKTAGNFDDYTEELIEPVPATPFSASLATIGKVTIIFGGDNPTYERALKTHEHHNRVHGYPVHVLRHGILNDVWTKPAYILSLLLKELTKPPGKRLKWLLWFDADTIIMNPNIPLDIFLPPDEFKDIHLLVTNDGNGLNNGVFPIRVHPWSVELMSAVVAFTIFRPDVNLVFRDQSALEEVLKEDRFRRNTVRLPQRWFNAYQSGMLNETIQANELRRGDLLVHFAGVGGREERMNFWMDLAEQHLPEWELDLRHTSYPGEIREYWADKQAEAESLKEQLKVATETAQKIIETTKVHLDDFRDELGDDEATRVQEKIDQLRKTVEEKAGQVEAIYKATDELQGTCEPLLKLVEKGRKEMIKQAHTAIYEAEKDTIHITDPSLEADVKSIESRIGLLRDVLVEKPDESEAITAGTEELQKATADLAEKIKLTEALAAVAHTSESTVVPTTTTTI